MAANEDTQIGQIDDQPDRALAQDEPSKGKVAWRTPSFEEFSYSVTETGPFVAGHASDLSGYS